MGAKGKLGTNFADTLQQQRSGWPVDIQLCTRQDPGSNFFHMQTCYPDPMSAFSLLPQANAGIVPQIRPRQLR